MLVLRESDQRWCHGLSDLSYAFQYVNDVHVKITNKSSGAAKLRNDYYIKDAHSLNNYYFKMKMIELDMKYLDPKQQKMIKRSKKDLEIYIANKTKFNLPRMLQLHT